MVQFSSTLKRTKYDLKNSFFPNFLLIHREKYIFSRDMFFKRHFELIYHSVNRKQYRLNAWSMKSSNLDDSAEFEVLTTLGYQINMQHVLLIFWKNPTCMALLHPACFINFRNFSSLHVFFTIDFWKIPSCTALFHPARFINFRNFPTCTFIPSYTFIWYPRVSLFQGNKTFRFSMPQFDEFSWICKIT